MNIGIIGIWIFCALLKAKDPLGSDISGDNQVGVVGQLIEDPVVVRVIDERGKGIGNAVVVFSILNQPKENEISGEVAVLDAETVYTDQDGYAKNRVRFGAKQGDYYILAQHGHELLTFHLKALERNWLLIMVLSIVGGMALFIFGLNYGSKGFIRGVGSKTRDFLFNLTSDRFVAIISGFMVTIVFGSCTATASLLIRFASAGIITLIHALAVILGANIGATVSVQLLAFNIMDYALLIVSVGVFLRILFPGLRNVAQFIFGFGLLFLSIKIMSVGVANIKYLSGFNAMIDWLNEYPIWGIILGTIFSFVFRSSTAVIGLILALSFESAIPLSSALLFVLGANLGTTIFPILISDTVYARRVALGNLFFKMIGVMICLPLIGFFENFLHFLGGTETRQIANFHTLFNVLISLIFLPLLHFFSDLIKAIVVETKKEILMKRKLDPSFLDTPAIGLGQAMKEVFYMADKAAKMLEDAIKVFERKDIVLRKEIIQADDEIDKTEEMLTTYISKLNTEEMDEDLRKTQVGLMTITAEIEHIGDIVSKSLMGYAKKQIDAGMGFSAEGFSEIKELHCFVLDTLRMAIASLTTRDKTLAQEILKRRETAIDMAKRFEVKHLERLHRGLRESIETSTIHLDILSELERINFHATEIGNAVIALIL